MGVQKKVIVKAEKRGQMTTTPAVMARLMVTRLGCAECSSVDVEKGEFRCVAFIVGTKMSEITQ